jgi:hypothetical protein
MCYRLVMVGIGWIRVTPPDRDALVESWIPKSRNE